VKASISGFVQVTNPTSKALRVYLASDIDEQPWTWPIVDAKARLEVAQQALLPEWAPLSVLPFEHAMTGPLGVRSVAKDSDLKIERRTKDSVHYKSEYEKTTIERRRLKALRSSDVVFAWVDKTKTELFGVELGYAYGLGKRVMLACATREDLLNHPMLIPVATRILVCPDMAEAYDEMMADLAYQSSDKFVPFRSKFSGTCKGCHGSYQKDDPIMWNRGQGSYHTDCYTRMENLDPTKSLISSELVGAIREENARLENENTTLMVKNSMLKAEVEKLRAQLLEG